MNRLGMTNDEELNTNCNDPIDWLIKLLEEIDEQDFRCSSAGEEFKQKLKKLSNDADIDWTRFVCDTCTTIIGEADTVHGGQGVKVEIDESKFAERKYHKGRRVGDKSWEFGAI